MRKKFPERKEINCVISLNIYDSYIPCNQTHSGYTCVHVDTVSTVSILPSNFNPGSDTIKNYPGIDMEAFKSKILTISAGWTGTFRINI